MGSKILFKNLFSLAKSMQREKMDYQVINNIKYKSKTEICAIFKFCYEDVVGKDFDERVTKTYSLGLFKKKTREYLELPLEYSVNGNFQKFEIERNVSKELYKKLKVFLGIEYSVEGKFSPSQFFNFLHAAIPTKADISRKERLVYSYTYNHDEKADDRDKVYFSHFLDNNKRGHKRSLENREKTQNLIPYANELIGERNISVCFTANSKLDNQEKDEIREKISDFSIKKSQNGRF